MFCITSLWQQSLDGLRGAVWLPGCHAFAVVRAASPTNRPVDAFPTRGGREVMCMDITGMAALVGALAALISAVAAVMEAKAARRRRRHRTED